MNVATVKPLIQKALKTISAEYRPQAEDTSIESDILMFYLLRQRSPSDRLRMAAGMNRSARSLSLDSFRLQFPHLNSTQFARHIAQAWLQEDCPSHFVPQGNDMTWIQDSISLARELHDILAGLDIPYYITGGVAAIAYGEPRTTRDLDLVLAIELEDLDRLVTVLTQADFYVPGIEDVKSGRMQTLGITHITSISRADLMLAGTGELEKVQLERRVLLDVKDVGSLYFASPEDVILNKLKWGQRSQSEKQWRDVLGILKVNIDRLDYNYLEIWANPLGVKEVLYRALREAGYNF